jgi:hypothetical protein
VFRVFRLIRGYPLLPPVAAPPESVCICVYLWSSPAFSFQVSDFPASDPASLSPLVPRSLVRAFLLSTFYFLLCLHPICVDVCCLSSAYFAYSAVPPAAPSALRPPFSAPHFCFPWPVKFPLHFPGLLPDTASSPLSSGPWVPKSLGPCVRLVVFCFLLSTLPLPWSLCPCVPESLRPPCPFPLSTSYFLLCVLSSAPTVPIRVIRVFRGAFQLSAFIPHPCLAFLLSTFCFVLSPNRAHSCNSCLSWCISAFSFHPSSLFGVSALPLPNSCGRRVVDS